MKKLNLLLLIGALALSSCKKEDKEPITPTQTVYSGQDTLVVKFIQKLGNGTLLEFRVSNGLDTWSNILLNTSALSVNCQDVLSNSQSLTLKKDSVYTIHATIDAGGFPDGGFHRVVKVVPNSSNNGLTVLNVDGEMYLGQHSIITCNDGVLTIEINDQWW